MSLLPDSPPDDDWPMPKRLRRKYLSSRISRLNRRLGDEEQESLEAELDKAELFSEPPNFTNYPENGF